MVMAVRDINERRGKMRGNNIRRCVTRGGQIIQDIMANGGDGAPGQADADDRMDIPRLASFVIIAFVSILMLILAVGVIHRVGEWALSGDKDTAIVEVEESAPAEINRPERDVEAEYFQKPISTRTVSSVTAHHDIAEDDADEDSYAETTTYEPAQLTYEKQTYQKRELGPETPGMVKYEPAVDYLTSVRKMETTLEKRRSEIQKITAELRGIGRSGEDGW